MSNDLWLKRIRNYAGFLGMILPYLALFSAGIAEHPAKSWWYSISATYYQTPALAGILTTASVVLMCYDGYTKVDSIVTTISGVFGIGIVLFPCSVSWLDAYAPVGFFQIPMHYSNMIHCTCATVFFLLLAFNSLFLFTKTDGAVTVRKDMRNRVYIGCGLGMILFMVWQVVCVVMDFKGFWTMINEIFLLQFFGISWLTKGGVILQDK